MTERNEVGILREATHHCKNNGLAADLGEALDEIQANVRPNHRGYRQRFKEACRLEMLGLVALACRARPHILLHHCPSIWHVEVATEPMQERRTPSWLSS